MVHESTRSRRLVAFIALAIFLALGASAATGQGTSTTTTTSTSPTTTSSTTTSTTSTSSSTSSTTSSTPTTTSTSTSTSTTSTPAGPPPINDAYLRSLNLNRPGTPLNDTQELIDRRDITGATVQSDIFKPPSHGGPHEFTGCNGTSEGHTIWYDFYPQSNGVVQIQTSAGFDTVLAVMPFGKKSLLPVNSERQCTVNRTTHSRQLLVDVRAGTDYTIQLGGAGDQAGKLEFLFNYVVSLAHLQPQTTLTALPTATGVQLVNLVVTTNVKAKVTVKCTTGCTSETRTGRTTMFPGLKGAALPAGAGLEIFATAKNTVGAFVEYKIVAGNFMKIQRCLKPGTLKVTGCGSS